MRRHLTPSSAEGLSPPIADIRPSHVRHWRKGLLDAGVGPVTVAKTYRLLNAILNTALNGGVIRRNACRLKGAAHRNTWRPAPGQASRELTDRIEDDSEPAAMVYLHGSDARQHCTKRWRPERATYCLGGQIESACDVVLRRSASVIATRDNS